MSCLTYLTFYLHRLPNDNSESAATLEAESGYIMESPEVAEFRRCILDGAWERAESGLMRLGVVDDPRFWASTLSKCFDLF